MAYSLVFALLALRLLQTTPSGGSIAKYVPPVPTPASFISDQRAVLQAAARSAIDARIGAIQKAGLGDIAVAILPSIGDYSPNEVSVEIYRTWKVGSSAPIGSARRNVGVLLLIVPKELAPNKRGECWINTGLGAEGIITDASAGTICRDSVIPYLREKDYASAVNAGVGAIEARLRGDAGLASAVADAGQRDGRRPFPWSIVLSVVGALTSAVAGVFGMQRWRRNRPRECPNCKRKMRRLSERADNAQLDEGQVVEEQVGSVDYDVWMCECGDKMVVPYVKRFSSYSTCRECQRKTARAKTKTLRSATTVSTGLAEKRFTCKACNGAWTEQVVLPVIVVTSSSSGGGGSGGGGGSSFGGSGATSGGGGGGSY